MNPFFLRNQHYHEELSRGLIAIIDTLSGTIAKIDMLEKRMAGNTSLVIRTENIVDSLTEIVEMISSMKAEKRIPENVDITDITVLLESMNTLKSRIVGSEISTNKTLSEMRSDSSRLLAEIRADSLQRRKLDTAVVDEVISLRNKVDELSENLSEYRKTNYYVTSMEEKMNQLFEAFKQHEHATDEKLAADIEFVKEEIGRGVMDTINQTDLRELFSDVKTGIDDFEKKTQHDMEEIKLMLSEQEKFDYEKIIRHMHYLKEVIESAASEMSSRNEDGGNKINALIEEVQDISKKIKNKKTDEDVDALKKKLDSVLDILNEQGKKINDKKSMDELKGKIESISSLIKDQEKKSDEKLSMVVQSLDDRFEEMEEFLKQQNKNGKMESNVEILSSEIKKISDILKDQEGKNSEKLSLAIQSIEDRINELEEEMNERDINSTKRIVDVLGSIEADINNLKDSMKDQEGKQDERLSLAMQSVEDRLEQMTDAVQQQARMMENSGVIEDLMELSKKMEQLNDEIRGIPVERMREDVLFLNSKTDNISSQMKKFDKMFTAVYNDKLRNSYLVSDEEFIYVLTQFRRAVMKGRIKILPKWARDKRREAIKQLGKRIDDAIEVLILKKLTQKKMNTSELSKNIPASSYTIKKTLARMVRENKIGKARQGRLVVYTSL